MRVDVLAIAPDASLVLIELKLDRTPREIIAQALDYAPWGDQLTPDRVAQIFQRSSGGKRLMAPCDPAVVLGRAQQCPEHHRVGPDD